MQAVGAIEDRSVKGKWHPRRFRQKSTKKEGKAHIGYCRKTAILFSIAPFLSTGIRRSQGVSVSEVTDRLVWEQLPLACLQLWLYL